MSTAALGSARPLLPCDIEIDVATRAVTFKQKRSRIVLVADQVTVPLYVLKQLVGQLSRLEGAGEQGGDFRACGAFDAATRKVATAVRMPGTNDAALSVGDVAPFKLLMADVLEVEGKEEEAGRFIPAMAVPGDVAHAALGGSQSHNPLNPT